MFRLITRWRARRTPRPSRGPAIQAREQSAARQRLRELVRANTAEYRYERPAR